MRPLSSGEDQIRDFSSAEANSSGELYLNIIRLLQGGKVEKMNSCDIKTAGLQELQR